MGWFNPKVNIEAFDYDTKRSWNATVNFDDLDVHGYGYYRYENQVDGGALDHMALAEGKWACRTYAYHVTEASIFHWYRS